MDEWKRALLPGTVVNSAVDDLFAGHCPVLFVRSLLSFFVFRCGWFLIFFLIPNFTMLQTPCHSTHLAGVQVLNNTAKYGQCPTECSPRHEPLVILYLVPHFCVEVWKCGTVRQSQDNVKTFPPVPNPLSFSDPEEVEYFPLTFSIKGSFWATRYQDALKKAVDLKANGVYVPFRASFQLSKTSTVQFGWSLGTVEMIKLPSFQKQ